MSSGAPAKKRVLITGGAGFIGSHVADELLTQGHVRKTGGPQFHLDAHETGGQVLFIKGACLRPFRRKVAWRSVHLRLPFEQLPIGLVEHSDDELVFASEVVMDQRMVDPGFGCNIAHVQARVSIGSQATVGRLENARSRL